MDLLGHIEFRRKDFLIHQMARVTKRGGGGHHAHRLTYLYPFLHVEAFAELFEEEFQQVVAGHPHPEAKQLALVILGRLNRYFIEFYTQVFGAAFQPNDANDARKWNSASRNISHCMA